MGGWIRVRSIYTTEFGKALQIRVRHQAGGCPAYLAFLFSSGLQLTLPGHTREDKLLHVICQLTRHLTPRVTPTQITFDQHLHLWSPINLTLKINHHMFKLSIYHYFFLDCTERLCFKKQTNNNKSAYSTKVSERHWSDIECIWHVAEIQYWSWGLQFKDFRLRCDWLNFSGNINTNFSTCSPPKFLKCLRIQFASDKKISAFLRLK